MDQSVDEIFAFAGFVAARVRDPVGFSEKHWHARRWHGVGERLSFLQDFLEVGQREAGVDRQKSALRINGFDEGRFLSAVGALAVTEDLQQRLCVLAVRNVNDSRWSSEVDQFPCLLDIAIQQYQIFGFACLRRRAFVTEQEDVARHQRRDLVGRDFLADSGHAQKRAHGTRNRYHVRGRSRRGRSGHGRLPSGSRRYSRRGGCVLRIRVTRCRTEQTTEDDKCNKRKAKTAVHRNALQTIERQMTTASSERQSTTKKPARPFPGRPDRACTLRRGSQTDDAQARSSDRAIFTLSWQNFDSHRFDRLVLPSLAWI